MLNNLFDDDLVALKSPHVFRGDTVRMAFPDTVVGSLALVKKRIVACVG
jgi:hypothetical protein